MVEFPTNILKPCGFQLSSDPKGVGHQISNNSGMLKFYSESYFHFHKFTYKVYSARLYQYLPDSKTVIAIEADVALLENCRMF